MRTAFVERVTPEQARVPCAPPVALPDRDLTEREVTDWWGQDRSALEECERRRAAGVGPSNGKARD